METRFSAPAHTSPGSIQPSVQWVAGLFLGGKAAWAGVNPPPPPSSAKVKELYVNYYYYYYSGPSWPGLEGALPFLLLGVPRRMFVFIYLFPKFPIQECIQWM